MIKAASSPSREIIESEILSLFINFVVIVILESNNSKIFLKISYAFWIFSGTSDFFSTFTLASSLPNPKSPLFPLLITLISTSSLLAFSSTSAMSIASSIVFPVVSITLILILFLNIFVFFNFVI